MAIVRKIVDRVLMAFNYQLIGINSSVKSASKVRNCNSILLNIGSGNWSHEGWINLDHPSVWYKKDQKKHRIMPYDIRKDSIPFEDNSVDAIYCSHVIEHIENKYIEQLLKECYRVLKKGGVLRITCPDAEFLYDVSKANNDFWTWRSSWFKSEKYYNQKFQPRTIDFLVREIATPKLLHYTNSVNSEDYIEAYEVMDMTEFFEFLTHNLQFREEYPGDHINYWTFDKAKSFLTDAGFETIIRSKWSASVFFEMQYISKFDTTHPVMSLYVEAVK